MIIFVCFVAAFSFFVKGLHYQRWCCAPDRASIENPRCVYCGVVLRCGAYCGVVCLEYLLNGYLEMASHVACSVCCVLVD